MIHRVRQGDHISKLAAERGLLFERVWAHPRNLKLRRQRKNPNILQPGDELYIPEPEIREETGVSEQRHCFRLRATPLWLRLDINDLLHRDLAGTPCELHLGSETRELTVADDGIIETPIPPDLERTILIIDGVALPLRIGEVDPVDQPAGQRERLRNLGYYNIDTDEEDDGGDLAEALERFQADHDLEVSGSCDEATRDKLLHIHGC